MSIKDRMIDIEIAENEKWLSELSKIIKNSPAFGSEFADRKWLETNADKILRNKQLINLLG